MYYMIFFYFFFSVLCSSSVVSFYFFFFFNDTATTEIYTLSLHDALPILLDKEWITVAWALESAALAWLSTRIRQDGLLKASAALAAAAFVRLVFNSALWQYHPRGAVPVLNWYLYTFGVPVVAFLLAARWSSKSDWARLNRM